MEAPEFMSKAIVWTRDDRDLLVELRTEMNGVRGEVSAARQEIKEINTGITARLLNLESNSVSKLQHDLLENKVENIETAVAVFRGQVKVWIFFGSILGPLLLLLGGFVINKYF